MKKVEWFERKFNFGLPKDMFAFYLERLEGTIARLERKVSGVSDSVLSNKLDGKWSIKQNIGHLAEVDDISCRRIDEIKQGVTPMSPAVFEPRQDYDTQPIQEVINYFKTTRSRNLLRYKSLSEDDLQKNSLHPRLQLKMSPVDLAWFEAEHDDHHLVRINEILTELSK
jgi:hypothetical protein